MGIKAPYPPPLPHPPKGPYDSIRYHLSTANVALTGCWMALDSERFEGVHEARSRVGNIVGNL